MKHKLFKLFIILLLLFHGTGVAFAISPEDRKAVDSDTWAYDPYFECSTLTGAQIGGDPECLGAKYPNIVDPNGYAKAIDAYIKKESPSSPLNGLGNIFVSAGSAHGVNPAYIVTIAKKESSFGTTGIATKGTNNPFGNSCDPGGRSWRNNPIKVTCKNIGVSGGPSQWNAYNSWQEGIQWVAFYIKDAYFAEGLDTIDKITVKYCKNCGGYSDQVRSYIGEVNKLAGPAILCGVAGPVVAATTGQIKPGKVYMLGDSILNKSQAAASGGLSTGGWSTAISALDGRPLNGSITTVPANAGKPNGFDQINADAQTIRDSIAIVIELGTNPGDLSDFGAQINVAVDKVRAINPTAPIYWVNIGASGNTIGNDPGSIRSAAMFSARNAAITANAIVKNYKIIDWAKTVFPDKNPQQIVANQPSSANLLDPDFVHPNAAGVTALAGLIVSNVTGKTQSLDGQGANQCDDTTTGGAVGGAGGFEISGPNAMVYYNQGDSAWAGSTYGRKPGTYTKCGCGPTSIAMMVATLTGKKDVTPVTVGDYIKSSEPQHMDSGCGSQQSITKVVEHYGLKSKPLGRDFNAAVNIIRSGGLVLLNIKGTDRQDDVSASAAGHFVILRKVDEAGKLYVANSGQRNDNEKAFDRAAVEAQLQGGSNPLYGVTR